MKLEDNIIIIIANIFGMIGAAILVYMGTIKEKDTLLKYQIIQVTFGSLCDLLLGGIPSVITNILTIIRNIFVTKGKFNRIVMLIFIVLSSILIINFNTLGIIGYIPLANFIFYTIFINTKDNIIFKYIFIISIFSWLIYVLIIKAYISAIFDVFRIITSIITLIKMKKEKGVLYE